MPDDEVAIYRGDVLAIMGAIADIHAWTRQILEILGDDEDEEEEEDA